MTLDPSEIKKTASIRALNDLLRTQGIGGQVIVVGGLAQMEDDGFRQKVVTAVRKQKIVTGDKDDPYSEHDFGQIVVDGQKFLWKIDYYDLDYKYASEAPENAKITQRVLSIMFASDY